MPHALSPLPRAYTLSRSILKSVMFPQMLSPLSFAQGSASADDVRRGAERRDVLDDNTLGGVIIHAGAVSRQQGEPLFDGLCGIAGRYRRTDLRHYKSILLLSTNLRRAASVWLFTTQPQKRFASQMGHLLIRHQSSVTNLTVRRQNSHSKVHHREELLTLPCNKVGFFRT